MLSLCLVHLSFANSANAIDCRAYFTTERIVENRYIISYWSHDGDEWSEPIDVFSDKDQPSFSPTMSFNKINDLVFLWVVAEANELQLYARVSTANGVWKNNAYNFTTSKGEKSNPRLFRALDNSLYAGWVSDESGDDDVYVLKWADSKKESDLTALNDKNSVPDIAPVFEYQETQDGSYDLFLQWKQLSTERLAYVNKQVLLQNDEYPNKLDQDFIDRCDTSLQAIGLPSVVSTGTYYFPYRSIDTHINVKLR